MTFDPSPVLEAFLAAEIRNADEGGDAPVTLGSARDSLVQMPDDVLRDLNPLIARLGADRAGLLAEIDALVSRHGRERAVEADVATHIGA